MIEIYDIYQYKTGFVAGYSGVCPLLRSLTLISYVYLVNNSLTSRGEWNLDWKLPEFNVAIG